MNQSKKQPLVTRNAILDAVGNGFAQAGYGGTGLNAVVLEAGVTKGGLFHHFADKQALALAWIDERLAVSIEAQWIAPVASADSLESLKATCRLGLTELGRGSATTTLAALTAELGARNQVLAARLEAIYAQWRAAFAALLERGKAAGGIHRSIKPPAEAAFLVALITGASITAACAEDPAALRACVTALDDYLNTLRNAPE